MRTYLIRLFAVVLMMAVSGTACAELASISGTITPTSWVDPWTNTVNFGIIADTTNVVDAQSQSVTVSGTIGTLPANADYWLEIGLVPKSVYDSPDFGFLPYIFNKGVTLYTKYASLNYEVGLLSEQNDADAICVNPVTNDGSISFSFTLTPSGGGGGGSGQMTVDGTTATYLASTTLPYTQNLTQSYLVGMVWVDSGDLDSVTVSASAVPEPSVLALLAAGGLSLLAYAWRRRRS